MSNGSFQRYEHITLDYNENHLVSIYHHPLYEIINSWFEL